MLTLDTSALYAIMRSDDPDHLRVRAARDQDSGPYYVATGILAEIAYLVESRLHLSVLQQFLLDLTRRAYVLDCGDADIPRISQLTTRYASLRLGFADAATIACAERHGGRVLTTDMRDFPVVARGERSITVIPG